MATVTGFSNQQLLDLERLLKSIQQRIEKCQKEIDMTEREIFLENHPEHAIMQFRKRLDAAKEKLKDLEKINSKYELEKELIEAAIPPVNKRRRKESTKENLTSQMVEKFNKLDKKERMAFRNMLNAHPMDQEIKENEMQLDIEDLLGDEYENALNAQLEHEVTRAQQTGDAKTFSKTKLKNPTVSVEDEEKSKLSEKEESSSSEEATPSEYWTPDSDASESEGAKRRRRKAKRKYKRGLRKKAKLRKKKRQEKKKQEKLNETMLLHQQKLRLNKVMDVNLVPKLAGLKNVGGMNAFEWRKWIVDYFKTAENTAGFEQSYMIQLILEHCIIGQAKHKLTQHDKDTVRTKEALIAWVDKHFDMSEMRTIIYQELVNWRFPKDTTWNSVVNMFKRKYEEMSNIIEGVDEHKIIATTMTETQKVDAIKKGIERSNAGLYQKLMNRWGATHDYPSDMKKLDAQLQEEYEFQKRLTRSELKTPPTSNIGVPSANAIYASDFGLQTSQNTQPRIQANSQNFGTSSFGNGTNTRTNTWNQSTRTNFRANAQQRQTTSARGARGVRYNRNIRNRTQNMNQRYLTENNIDWNKEEEIQQLGMKIGMQQRNRIMNARGSKLTTPQIVSLYGIRTDDKHLIRDKNGLLTGGVRCVVGGACNRCRKFGHFGKYCVYLNERFPDLVESYHTKVVSERRNSNQINVIDSGMNETGHSTSDSTGTASSSNNRAENPATEQMKSFAKSRI